MNSCVDRKYYQNVVSNLSEENLHDLELSLANKIIRNYERTKQLFINARNDFIRKKLEASQKEHALFLKNKQEIERRAKTLEDQKNFAKTVQILENKMHRKNSVREISMKNFYVKMFV